ncbi:MAG: LamG domain-containing protein, partial [Planctomycetota bacterium]|nr:LamG domain-containing protein [Planctomycetota bacterium]
MTTTAAVPSGQSIVVCAVVDDTGGLTVSCSDSAGNSYSQDAHRDSGGIQTFIFSSHNVNALASGGTITISLSTNRTAKAMSAAAFDLLQSTGAFDRDADNGGNGTDMASGTTATTNQGEELLVGAIGVEGPSSDSFTTSLNTAGYNGWAAPAALRDGTTGGSDTSNVTINYLFQSVVTAGQYEAFGTNGNSRDWNACIATYRYASGEDRFWIGNTAGNFNNDARWSTTSGGANNTRAPRAIDRAIFTNGGSGNCTITADALANGIEIRSTYAGTVTQNNGVQLFLGTQGFSQAAGTFNGGNSRIVVNGAYTLSGGTFRATSSRLTVETFTRTGGTFNHNNGTVVIRNPANQSLTLPAMNSLRLESTLENGLIGHWKFDEGLGRVARDLSGTGNHGGFLTCPVRQNATVAPLVFDNPQAMTFGGNLDDSLDAVAVPSSASLNTTAAITVSAWINPTAWNVGGFDNPRIVQKGVNDDQFRLTKEGTNLRWEIITGGATRTVNTSLPSTGNWHHLVGRYNGSTVQLFVDGALAGSVNATGNIQTTNDHLIIGAKRLGAPYGDYFRGQIDDVRIYNRGISDAEVAELYAGRYAQGSTGAAAFSFAANPTFNGILTLDSGILNLAANRTITLANGGGVDIQNGTLRNTASSSWSNPAVFTGSTTSARYSFTTQSGSILDLNWVKIENLNASGMVLANNSTVSFNHVWFDRGAGGGTGTYITSQKNQNFTINNTSFAAGYVNYGVTNT